ADRLAPIEVHAVVPQLAVRRERARDGRALGTGPARPVGVRLESVELGEHPEEQRDADGDRGRGDQQPDQALPAAAEGEPQAEAQHQSAPFATGTDEAAAAVRSTEETRPSRTMATRSAYAAVRASWVTITTVAPCSRASPVIRSMTFSPVS